MKKHTVFLDESGNTGSNLLDFNQPIFTFVGIGIDHEKMAQILLDVEDIKSKYSFNRNQRLHAINIRKKRRNNLVKEILELLLEYKCFLFVNIAEKRFVIDDGNYLYLAGYIGQHNTLPILTPYSLVAHRYSLSKSG